MPPRTLVMGIVNVTPDSFSDGGRWYDEGAAVAHGLDLLAQGADLVDVGGESTRPGAARPDAAEEARRVIPVIRRLAAAGARVSVDTMRAAVAAAALEAGAELVNDVSGGLADPAMFGVVAAADAPYVLMHWRAHGAVMNDLAVYDDVVTDVRAELGARVDAALAAGIAPERLILDPGLGFSKNPEHNWALLAALPRLSELGFPILVGASRKRFLGALMAAADGADDAAGADGAAGDLAARDAATTALSVVAAQQRAWGVRVHDVVGSVAAVRVVAALAGADRGRATDGVGVGAAR